MSMNCKFQTIESDAADVLFEKIAMTLTDAVNEGLATEEAIGIAAGAVADFARLFHGDEYLPYVADIVVLRKEKPQLISVRTDG